MCKVYNISIVNIWEVREMLKVIHNKEIKEVFCESDIKEIKKVNNYDVPYLVIVFHNNSMYILNDGYSIEF
jgi:hypothetical protein